MALTVDQTVYLQTQLGTGTDADDLEARYTRLGDVIAVAREVLEIRLADLESQPEQFNVAGEYGQTTKEQMAAIRGKLVSLGTSEDEPTASTARLVSPARRPRR